MTPEIEKQATVYSQGFETGESTRHSAYIAGATGTIDLCIAKIAKLKDAILPDEFASTYHDAAINKAIKVLERLKSDSK